MLNKLLQDPALPEITLVLALLVAFALWQKLNRAAWIMGLVYLVYLFFILIIPAKEVVHPYQGGAPVHVEETVFPDEIPEEYSTISPQAEAEISPSKETESATTGNLDNSQEVREYETTEPVESRDKTAATAEKAIAPILSAAEQSLVVNSIVTSQEVENRNPVGIDSIFSTDQKRVYCVTGIRNLKPEVTVYHKWYYQGKLRVTVPITLGWSHNWRAWSYVTLRPGLSGQWRVEVEDSLGQVLKSLPFTVIPADSL